MKDSFTLGECKTRLTKASREIQDTLSSATLPQCSVLQAGRDHLARCFTQQRRICLEVQHAYIFKGAAQRPGICIASSGSSDGSELSGCPGTIGVAAWASSHQWYSLCSTPSEWINNPSSQLPLWEAKTWSIHPEPEVPNRNHEADNTLTTEKCTRGVQ